MAEPEALRQLAKISLVFYGLAGLWLAMLGVTVFFGHLEGELPPGVPPRWASQVAIGGTAALHAVAGAWIQPGKKGSWGLAVSVLCLSLLNCVSFPIACWGIWLLFRPEVKSEVLGGIFRKPPPGSGGGEDQVQGDGA